MGVRSCLLALRHYFAETTRSAGLREVLARAAQAAHAPASIRPWDLRAAVNELARAGTRSGQRVKSNVRTRSPQ